jgi:hypothetical protein
MLKVCGVVECDDMVVSASVGDATVLENRTQVYAKMQAKLAAAKDVYETFISKEEPKPCASFQCPSLPEDGDQYIVRYVSDATQKVSEGEPPVDYSYQNVTWQRENDAEFYAPYVWPDVDRNTTNRKWVLANTTVSSDKPNFQPRFFPKAAKKTACYVTAEMVNTECGQAKVLLVPECKSFVCPHLPDLKNITGDGDTVCKYNRSNVEVESPALEVLPYMNATWVNFTWVKENEAAYIAPRALSPFVANWTNVSVTLAANQWNHSLGLNATENVTKTFPRFFDFKIGVNPDGSEAEEAYSLVNASGDVPTFQPRFYTATERKTGSYCRVTKTMFEKDCGTPKCTPPTKYQTCASLGKAFQCPASPHGNGASTMCQYNKSDTLFTAPAPFVPNATWVKENKLNTTHFFAPYAVPYFFNQTGLGFNDDFFVNSTTRGLYMNHQYVTVGGNLFGNFYTNLEDATKCTVTETEIRHQCGKMQCSKLKACESANITCPTLPKTCEFKTGSTVQRKTKTVAPTPAPTPAATEMTIDEWLVSNGLKKAERRLHEATTPETTTAATTTNVTITGVDGTLSAS